MQIKKVIKQVALLLQISNIINANLDDQTLFDTQMMRDVELIVDSINDVLCDISTDFLTLKTTEKISVSGEFDLSNLSKRIYKILSIYPTIKYSVVGNKLICEDGEYEIEYQYLPAEKTIDDKIDEFGGKLTLYALSYGVASQYCMICGNYSESEMWNSKYQDAMQIAMRSSKIVSLKNRIWCWKI